MNLVWEGSGALSSCSGVMIARERCTAAASATAAAVTGRVRLINRPKLKDEDGVLNLSDGYHSAIFTLQKPKCGLGPLKHSLSRLPHQEIPSRRQGRQSMFIVDNV